MPPREPALVNPALLRWGREGVRLSLAEAATRLKVKEIDLRAWETGEGKPSVPQLRKLASLYRRPIAVFYLGEPPGEEDLLFAFRRLPEHEEREVSYDLALELRFANGRREVALELAREADQLPEPFGGRAKTSEGVPAVARRLRELLGVTLEEQEGWQQPYAALGAWRQALERQGILTFQASLSREEMRGFSIVHERFPLVTVNTKDSPRARCFSLLHELTHLALGSGALCGSEEERGEDTPDPTERFCNAVAAVMLVPEEALDRSPGIPRAGARAASLEADQIKRLCDRFQASEEVVLRRLAETGRISGRFLQQEIRRLRSSPPPKQQSGPVPVFRKVISSLGATYVRTVLSAHAADRITLSQVATYLGTRLKHLPKIEQAAWASGGRKASV
ncbi:MAG TPA: XRE family transcriptional regulator [Myxococcales bacterium]|nr:XRE family transcriptional regulator [Myxococcales bacterium]